MDMNVTIYLPDELGERVKKADLEVSRICQGALTREVENREAEKSAKKKGKFKRIEVEVGDPDKQALVTKAFEGEWLVEDLKFTPEDWGQPSGGDVEWNVALTKGGRIAIHCQLGPHGANFLNVYESLGDAASGDDPVPEEVLATAAAAMGVERVIELDI